MKVDVSTKNSYTLVSLDGDLDGNSSNDVHAQLLSVLGQATNIIFEMKDCGYVSSAGLRVLLMSAKQLKKNGGKGVFVNLSSEIEEVMEMTGFDNIFKSYKSMDEAVADLGKE